MSFIVKETHFQIWDPILHLLVIPLSFHWEQFLSLLFYLFWREGQLWSLHFFRSTGPLHCRISLILHLSVLSWLCRVRAHCKYPTGNVLCFSEHHTGEAWCLFTPLLLRFVWLRWCLSHFFTVELPLFPLLSIKYLIGRYFETGNVSLYFHLLVVDIS